MPKRACPFAESFSSQYKIHVGQKELNHNGVLGNIYRQEIFDKTKTLLFNGARAVMGKLWNVEGDAKKFPDPQPEAYTSTPTGTQSLLKGQTLIGQDGRLRRTATGQGESSINPSFTAKLDALWGPAGPAGCCVCRQPLASRQQCSRCDRRVCSSCTQLCSCCSSTCCSVCTTVE
ncbi:apoptosis regulatory protein Siva [Aplochiton taeniatus]